jgi:RNA polymerase sigma factor (sigma-70 family)
MNDVLAFVRAAAASNGDAPDADLLTAYVAARDETAFEGLLRRHGPTVLGACRRVLGAGPDADDAFQATFLVLARKAGSVSPRGAVGGWLYGVAVKAALKVRTAEARRRTKEREATTMPRPADDPAAPTDDVTALNREIARLPDDLRAALVLCELEGKTRAAAARQLGWPEGTVASRLARARRILARRLKVAVPVLAPLSTAVVPAPLVSQTLAAAATFARGSRWPAAAGTVAEEVITDMLLTKLTKGAAVLFAAVAAAGLGLGLASVPSAAAPTAKPPSLPADPADALKTARPINVALLQQDEVQTELKLNPDQRQTVADLIRAALDEQRAAFQAAMGRGGVAAAPALPAVPLPPGAAAGGGAAGGGGVRFAGVGPMGPVKYDYEKLTAALKPEQLVRLRQIELHAKGPQAFADRRVVRTLGLTAEQEQKIEEIIVKYEPAFAEALGAAGFGPAADLKPVAELSEKYVTDCVRLLGKDQKAAWEWLMGARPAAGQWVRAGSSASGGGVMSFQGAAGPARIAVPGIPAAPPVAPPPPGVVVPPPPVAPPPPKP